MKRTEAQFDKIERYLRGEMPPAEVADFERAIANDPDLEMEVDMQRLEQDTMEVLLEDKLRANLKSWQQTPPPSPQPPPTSNRRWWLWASLILLIGITTWFVLPKNKKENTPGTPEQVAPDPRDTANKPPVATKDTITLPQENIAPQEDTPNRNNTSRRGELLAMATEAYSLPLDLQPGNLKSDNPQALSPLDAGIEAFEAKKYRKTIQELKDLTPAIGEDYYDRAQELLGHSYYLNKQYRNAAQIFEKMANDQEYYSVRQYGEWYLTLSLLPDYEKNKTRVDTLLSKMATTDGHNYKKQAADLQQKLQQMK